MSGVLNLFYHTGVRDAHCGMRALRRDILPKLDLRTTGMEFASEMVIRASKEHLDIRQIPIEYRPREGESKLSSFRDGWRHLRFLLIHQPNYLFLVPGAVMALLGFLIALTVIAQVDVLGRRWDIHTMIGGTLLTGMLATVVAIVVGYYIAVLSSRFGLDPDNQSVPIITSVMDLAGIIAFLSVLSLLGVATHG